MPSVEIKVDQVWVFVFDGETRRMRVARISQGQVTLVDADPVTSGPGHAMVMSPENLRHSAIPEDPHG